MSQGQGGPRPSRGWRGGSPHRTRPSARQVLNKGSVHGTRFQVEGGGHAECWGQGHLQRDCLCHRSCGGSRLPCVAHHPAFPPLLGPLLPSLSPGACRLLPCTPGRGGWPLALAPLPASSLGLLSSQPGPQNGPLPRSRAKGPQGAGRGGLGWGCQDQGWMQVRWARHPRLPQNTHTHRGIHSSCAWRMRVIPRKEQWPG